MEETGERGSKVALTPLARTSATSLFLARWISRRRSCKRNNDAPPAEDDRVHGEYPLAENPSFVEDSTVCANERLSSIQLDRTSMRINEDFIRNVLAEHTRRTVYRSHLWEDLKELDVDEERTNDAETFFAVCKPNEINALLLQACFAGRTDLIRRLCEHGASVDYAEPNHGLTPLHLCAFQNCLDGVQYLMAQGASPVDHGSKYTPFHYATFGDAFDVARYLLQCGVSEESTPDEETVLHVAARTNALRVLSLLAPNSKHLDRLDPDGYAAIHHAADGGDSDCLHALLQAGCCVDLATGVGNDTALHLAAEAGCSANVALLIEAGANVQLTNRRGYTALHLAARSHCLECVEILLKGGANSNATDNEGRTPLHLALGPSIVTDDIVELLLTWRANVNKTDKYGYTPLHIAASNELSRCVNLLIRHEADLSAKTDGGTSALSIVLRKTPTSLDVFERRLDTSMTLHRQGLSTGELELRLDFRPLLQHRRQGEVVYLDTFVKEGYKEILEHPLCQSFLHLKWQKIRKYYVARLLFYLVYVLSLTGWVMTLARNCYNESHGYVDEPPLCANATGLYRFLYEHPAMMEAQWYALMVLTVLEALRKLTLMSSYLSVRQFFMHAENLVEWFVILSVFATSFVYTGRTYAWQNHLGAFAVLCGWSNLMLMIGQLPVFGAYVAMFTSVQAQVFKLLLVYSCLLVGFTVSFCVIFPRSKSFSSPHMGLIKVLVMMTGELGFEDLFFPSDKIARNPLPDGTSWVLLQISAQISFVLFLLFVTIVLMNLLIGIAVHDIKGLQKTAGLAKLVRQTKLICNLEIAFFFALLPKRLIKCLRRTALVMPSPLRAVLTVRPLNPRETRLPRDVLSDAYKIAKESDNHDRNNFAMSRRKTYGPAKTCFKGDVYSSACRRRGLDEDTLAHDCSKLKDDIAELRKICEKNQTLLRELLKTRAVNK